MVAGPACPTVAPYPSRMPGSEVVVIGGGIVGTAAAAFLAEQGASVLLLERTDIGAGASGRNLGALQHPYDRELVALHTETLAIYRAMIPTRGGFAIPETPAGLLILSPERAVLEHEADRLRGAPELRPDLLEPRRTRSLEPGLADDLWSLRLDTGYPVPPRAATAAMAERALAAGVRIETGRAAVPSIERGRVTGVLVEGARHVAADSVLLAAGPWSPYLLDPSGRWRPIAATWGATAQLSMAAPPRHVLEEVRVAGVNQPVGADDEAAPAPDPEATPSLFTLAAADGVATIGSTFLAAEPNHRALGPILVNRGVRYLPALRDATVTGTRACARPQSLDGRPLTGHLPGVEGLVLAAGHGPWGISCGPATARMAVAALLAGSDDPVPQALRAARFADAALAEALG
jgi:glycine/D-amino acid oxidase-like deaminating enzyme